MSIAHCIGAHLFYKIEQKRCLFMSMASKIKMILIARDMTAKQLSVKMGYNENYLYNKFSRDNLSEQELIKIAAALDCDFEGVFTMRDTGKTF